MSNLSSQCRFIIQYHVFPFQGREPIYFYQSQTQKSDTYMN